MACGLPQLVRSPLRVRVSPSLGRGRGQLVASATFEDRALNLASGMARLSALQRRPASWLKRQLRRGPDWSDRLKAREAATMPLPKPEVIRCSPS